MQPENLNKRSRPVPSNVATPERSEADPRLLLSAPPRADDTAMPGPIPVSTLARYAANPEGFTTSPGRRTAAMDRAAEHGIRWHERLGVEPDHRRSRTWRWALLLILTAAAALILFG